MLLNNRHGSVDSDAYRYAFQGQERDDEVKGEGNSYNYTYRMHDPRLGRFLATDPLAPKYPYYTPYQFSGNKVIHAIELEGLEEHIVIKSPYVRDAILEYMSCDEVINAIGAARNSENWETQAEANHARKTFDIGQMAGPSSVRTNEDEFDSKGIEVWSYNNEGEMMLLFSGIVEVETDIKKKTKPSKIELGLALAAVPIGMLVDDVNNFFKPSSSKTKISSSSQGGVTFKVTGLGTGVGSNGTIGNPETEIDITALYAIGGLQAGAGATKSQIINSAYAINKSIEQAGTANNELNGTETEPAPNPDSKKNQKVFVIKTGEVRPGYEGNGVSMGYYKDTLNISDEELNRINVERNERASELLRQKRDSVKNANNE